MPNHIGWYAPEFKAEEVSLAKNGERSVTQTARDLDIAHEPPRKRSSAGSGSEARTETSLHLIKRSGVVKKGISTLAGSGRWYVEAGRLDVIKTTAKAPRGMGMLQLHLLGSFSVPIRSPGTSVSGSDRRQSSRPGC